MDSTHFDSTTLHTSWWSVLILSEIEFKIKGFKDIEYVWRNWRNIDRDDKWGYMNEISYRKSEKESRCRVLSDTLFSMVNNGCDQKWHTRFPSYIVFNSMALVGEEKIDDQVDTRMRYEHVVPLVYLISKCLENIENDNPKREDIAQILIDNFYVIKISEENAMEIDKDYKTKMPKGWKLGEHCPFDRLRKVFNKDLEGQINFFKGFERPEKYGKSCSSIIALN